MNLSRIHWVSSSVGAVVAEAGVIAASFAWVAIYSYLINPNQPLSVYEQHARDSGPWVSIVAGVPIFYAAARWMARSRSNGLVMAVIVIVFDALVLVGMGGAELVPLLPLVVASYATKLAAAWWGGSAGALESSPRAT